MRSNRSMADPQMRKTASALKESLHHVFDEVQDAHGDYGRLLDPWLNTGQSPLIITPPGSGKSYITTQLVNRMYEEHGLATIVFVLSHDIADSVPGRDGWKHWKAHHRYEACDKAKNQEGLRKKRYEVSVSCDCDWAESFSSDHPTVSPIDFLAPVDLVQLRCTGFATQPPYRSVLPESLRQIRPEIEHFPLRIIDELDFGRLTGRLYAPRDDIETCADAHPDHDVRNLGQALVDTLKVWRREGGNSAPELVGRELWSRVADQWPVGRMSLGGLSQLADTAQSPTTGIWLDWPENELPMNFPPYLLPIMSQELDRILRERPFNPRVKLVPRNKKACLQIRWRKVFPHYLPTLFLDATASPMLVDKAFDISGLPEPERIEIPPPGNVKVMQRPDNRYGRQALGLWPPNQERNKAKKSRQKRYDTLINDLSGYPRTRSVGVVTFKALEDELRRVIERAGFLDVRSLHYLNVRSSNELKDVDLLILFGCPTPPPDEFIAEVRAFFFDETPLDIEWMRGEEIIRLRNGRSVSVQVGGYFFDQRMWEYFDQKCGAEMFQALHRCRPNLVPPGERKDILIYTNIPVPGVLVDGFLGREGICAEALRKIMTSEPECSAPQLARKARLPGLDDESAERWIRRHTERMAALAGVMWEGRRFRKPV